MKSIVRQEYWDNSYENVEFKVAENNSDITNLLDQYISNIKNKSVFEFGCFPGSYIAYLGKRGAIISGIDLTPRTREMTHWLETNNISIGKIRLGNVITDKNSDKYDIVCSFGFIEHFEDWKTIIDLHDAKVEKNGIVVITCPNFLSPLNWLYHRIFDWENLDRHNISSMDMYLWEKYLLGKKYDVLFCGNIGSPKYWFDTNIKNQRINDFRNKVTIFLNNNIKKIKMFEGNKPINAIVAIKK